MPRKAGNSPKAERDELRDRMRGYGCTVSQIAAEMSRRFNLRPRVAWRHALGWPQWKLAQRYNTDHPGARLSDNRISEFEAWPHGGCLPSLRYLAQLAVTFGHGCTREPSSPCWEPASSALVWWCPRTPRCGWRRWACGLRVSSPRCC
ncbi:MAG: hypothetical protein ACRDQ4_01715 [Pseudonocardiaceae bacterium]